MIELVGCVLIGIIGFTFIAMLIDELRTNYKIRKDLEGDNKMDEYMEAKSHPISSCAELSKYFIGRHEIVPVCLTPQFEKEFNAKMYQLENLQQTLKELNAKIIIMEKYLELIADLSYDYDGCNSVDGLKELIDELKKYANLGRVCNLSEAIFQDGSSSYNILHEKLKEED